MSFLSFSSKKNDLSPRWFAGLNVSINCRRIESAMIGVHGRGNGAPVEIRKAISFDLPPEITESYNALQQIISGEPPTRNGKKAKQTQDFPELYHHLVRELASVEEEAIIELIGESRLPKNEILAVGIHDPGVFQRTSNGLFYQSLCDGPSLAEQTGLNIIDAFPAQDVASHGHGGPVLALPSWIFLKSDSKDRILIDLGGTAKITFLPKAEHAFSHQKIQYRDIVPCGSLLDTLTWQLTRGKTLIDVGGRLTVQGCQITSLLDDLRAIPGLEYAWNSQGLSPKPLLDVLAKFDLSEHSTQDVLCTASYFIAEAVAGGVQKMLEYCDSEPEILLTGSARMHGMLMNVISSGLGKPVMTPITQFGFPTETYDAICVAMLSLMTVDQIPSNIATLTGSETSKSLGRITPGSVAAWQKLLQELVQAKPTARSLRSAV